MTGARQSMVGLQAVLVSYRDTNEHFQQREEKNNSKTLIGSKGCRQAKNFIGKEQYSSWTAGLLRMTREGKTLVGHLQIKLK